MTEKEVFARLHSVFRDVFDDRGIRLTRETTAADIEDWDSLEHIRLMQAVEEAFRVRLSMREVSTLKNVGELADILAVRGK